MTSTNLGNRSLLFPILFLFLLPLLSVTGTQLVNLSQNNVILLILILLLALVPVLVAFGRFIPNRLYPFAVVMVALALLYHTSLISKYLLGTDIHQEYYFANLVKINSTWDSTIPNNYNAMLSIAMLAPILSNICGISLIWVFKIIYPSLFSLVPLVLYQIFKKQVNEKIAFLGAFFFMSVFIFFDVEMISLARQQIAELFLGLLILLIISKSMNGMKRVTLLVVFSASIVTSHYATSYIFMFSLACSLFALSFMQRTTGELKKRAIKKIFVFLYFVLALSWYIYVSKSATFTTIISISENVARNISKFLSPEAAQGLNILLRETGSLVHEAHKILHVAMQFFITIGIFDLVLRRVKKKSIFDYEFASLSMVSFSLNLAAITVPYMASSLNTTRLYHLTLFFLAPFSILGAVAVFKFLSNMKHFKKRIVITTKTSLKGLSMILGVFLLFNTGFVYEVIKDHPSSISLSQNWIKEYGSARERFAFYGSCTPVQEVISALWLSRYRDNKSEVYADYRARNNVLNAYAMISRDEGHAMGAWGATTILIMNNSYVYLRKVNIFEGLMGGEPKPSGLADVYNATMLVLPLHQKANKIYSNRDSEIYYTSYSISLELPR